MGITREEIAAFADGQLEAEREAEIAKAVAADPALAGHGERQFQIPACRRQAVKPAAQPPVRRQDGDGGIVFERYRGNVGGVPYVPEDRAFAVPEGVPDLFITNFAPADYMETVNTNGLPYYASQELLPHNKGVDLEAQSNPLSLCTRPGAVIKLTA